MISKILDNLYIGTVWDSYGLKKEWGLRICVAEWGNFSPEEQHDLLCQNTLFIHAPFMIYEKPEAGGINGPIPVWNSYADIDVLNNTADLIKFALANKLGDILIHCAAGVERSPLVVIWYLSKYNNFSFEEAYEFVKQRRPMIENRLTWIRKGR